MCYARVPSLPETLGYSLYMPPLPCPPLHIHPSTNPWSLICLYLIPPVLASLTSCPKVLCCRPHSEIYKNLHFNIKPIFWSKWPTFCITYTYFLWWTKLLHRHADLTFVFHETYNGVYQNLLKPWWFKVKKIKVCLIAESL